MADPMISRRNRNNRKRGAAWERRVAEIFRDALGLDSVKRGLGQARSAGEVPDVRGVPDLWPECKHGRQVNLRAALAQAIAAVEESGTKALPVAIAKDRGRGKPPLVIMRLSDWMSLLARLYREDAPSITVDDPEE